MANSKHLDILKEGIAAWNDWRERNPGIQPDLSRSDLSGASLPGVNLKRANLKRATLKCADLEGANLEDAALTSANLERANLKNAILTRANFFDSILTLSCLANTSLESANLRDAEIERADLSCANLANANLVKVSLADTDLSGAILEGAILDSANLYRANLSSTYLRRARIIDASLVDSELTGADMACAIIDGARLKRANLKNAFLGHSVVSNVDLAEPMNIDSIFHLSSSAVSTSTLAITAERLSKEDRCQKSIESFLRGAGLDDRAISYFQSLIGRPNKYCSCFISYSHKEPDKSFAELIYNKLQKCGVRCWLDDHNVFAGDYIKGAIENGIRGSDKVLLCCSRNSLTSEWVGLEIDNAIKKERQFIEEGNDSTSVIIPLDLDNYLFEWNSSKADLIQSRFAPDFTGWLNDKLKLERQFSQVLEALRIPSSAYEKT
ncbi:MAG: toll/interleukin-1 receptor domain-containing protein [Candidatus Thorarchaeota archaeon]